MGQIDCRDIPEGAEKVVLWKWDGCLSSMKSHGDWEVLYDWRKTAVNPSWRKSGEFQADEPWLSPWKGHAGLCLELIREHVKDKQLIRSKLACIWEQITLYRHEGLLSRVTAWTRGECLMQYTNKFVWCCVPPVLVFHSALRGIRIDKQDVSKGRIEFESVV